MLTQFIKLFTNLLFPNLCLSCLSESIEGDEIYCFACNHKLDKTELHMHKENGLTNRLVGIEGIYTGAAFHRFYDDSPIEKVIHRIKYEGRSDIAEKYGRHYGEQLIKSELYQDVEWIIPVPLHPKKHKSRGYNQSEAFAIGLAYSMNIKVNTSALKRVLNTKTQTKMSKLERQKNVGNAFQLAQTKGLSGKHVLLVDDVITTGSTIEGCTKQLIKIPNLKLSIAAIALREF